MSDLSMSEVCAASGDVKSALLLCQGSPAAQIVHVMYVQMPVLPIYGDHGIECLR